MAADSQVMPELSSGDLRDVLEAVYSISPGSVVKFGLSLNLGYALIQSFQMENDPKGLLRVILNNRLKQEPPLTWKDIIVALRSPAVLENRLASEIESKYMIYSEPISTILQQEGDEVSTTEPISQYSPEWPTQIQSPHLQSSTHGSKGSTAEKTEPPSKIGRLLPAVEVASVPFSDSSQDKNNSGTKTVPVSHLIPAVTYTSSGQVTAGREHSLQTSATPPLQSYTHSHSGTIGTYQSGSVNVPNVQQTSGTEDIKHSWVPHSYKFPESQPHVYPGDTLPYGLPQLGHSESQHTALRSYADYLKAIYRQYAVERNISVVKWPPSPSRIYINLAMVNRQPLIGGSKQYDEITEAMVRDGNVDAILEAKVPLNFSEIAKRERSICDTGGLILVEGAQGAGKSTFAWEFCRRWERGEIAQQYKLVLLLRLREERISNAKCLLDLIYHPSKSVCHDINKELEFNLGQDTLIILEGFDELPDKFRKDRSFFMDLIGGKLLPRATIIVTSRPWAARDIRLSYDHRIYQHVEILGFTNHQITEYIESTLPQDKVRELMAYLESHPQIRAGMYLPLQCAIIVTVFEESLQHSLSMPSTLTELYNSLIQTMLLRYLRGHPEFYNHNVFLMRFEDLPMPIYDKFCKLSKLAYAGIYHTKHQVQLIFRDLPSDFDDLGFMDSVTELYMTRGAVSSYNFLHLTLQEYFAAVHISRMSPAQQVEHFKRHEEGRLKVVLRFLAGLTKLSCFSSGKSAEIFFQTPSTHKGKRYLCDVVGIGVDFVQWLFEAQSDDATDHLLGQKTVEFDLSSALLPLDYYSLGYCISRSQCQWVLRLGKGIEEDEVRKLAGGVSTRAVAGGRVVGLGRMLGLHETQGEVPVFMSGKCLNILFAELKDILFLNELSIQLPVKCDHITWPDLSALRVLEVIISGTTKWKLNTLLPHLSLDSLTIAPASNGAGIVCEDCVAIEDHVSSTTSLKELRIVLSEGYVMHISDGKGVEAITAALASNQSLPLERFEFQCECTLTATAGDSLVQFVTNTTTLQYLSIMYCTFSAHAMLVLLRAITQNSNLQTKNFKNFENLNLIVNSNNEAKDLAQLLVEYPDVMRRVCYQRVLDITDEGATVIAQALQHDSTLLGLHISSNSFSDAGTVALAQGLHHNSTLMELKLSKNSIYDGGAVALAQALHHNAQLEKLYLSRNYISDAGAVALAMALHHNNNLMLLDVSSNRISDAGAVALAQALHHNSTVQWLYLSDNVISDAGAVTLAQALHHNSTLAWLDLYGNDGIGEGGTCTLVKALTVNQSTGGSLNLSLPQKCKEYATQSPGYNAVDSNIMFC